MVGDSSDRNASYGTTSNVLPKITQIEKVSKSNAGKNTA